MDKKAAFANARSHDWLSGASAEIQDEILTRCDLLHFPAGAALYHQGDPAGGLYGVVEGALMIYLPNPTGAVGLVHVTGAGFWTGEFSALTGRPRRITMTARTDCWILRLPRAGLTAVLDKHPVAWRHLSTLQTTNLRLTLNLVDMLKRDDPVERLTMMLLNLCDADDTVTRTLHVLQSELAALCQLSRATVNSATAELERRGWIKRGYGHIDLIDLDAMTKLVRGA